MADKQQPQPMNEPVKKHGDKIKVDNGSEKRQTGQAGEPQTTPLEPADTAQVGGAAYAPHDQDAEKLTEKIGDNRKPEETIGEIKYAKKPDKKQGESR